MSFRVELEVFRGPLDLLLYLVRKHEVEITDLPIASITAQFLEHLSVLKELDVNFVGDFLEMASTLVEIKSRMVLPGGDEVEEALEDPRQELVRQLLEYKRFKDAASILDERSRAWQERFPRLANDLPPRQRDLAEEPIHELELWDLVSAFGRIMRDRQGVPSANIVYDDTPIHVFMGRIRERMAAEQRVALGDLFQANMHKSTLVGIFLAILELVRHHSVHAEQSELFGEIWISPGNESDRPVDAAAVTEYEHGGAKKVEKRGQKSEVGGQNPNPDL